MAALSFIRAKVRDRIHELLIAHPTLEAVEVYRSLAPQQLERTALVIFDAEQSETEVRDLRAGRKSYRDVFEFDVGVTAQDGYDSPSDAERRADELVSALLDTVADDPTLGGGNAGLAGLTRVEIIQYEGPASFPTENAGWVAHSLLRLRAWTETE